VEEDRFLRFVHEVLADLARPLFDWSKIHGLRKFATTGGQTRLGETDELSTALAHVSELQLKAVFVFNDIGPLLNDPALIRQLRETVTRLYQLGSSLILVGANITMHPELQPAVTKFEFELPIPRELSLLVHSSLKSLGNRHQFTVDLGEDDRDHLVDALRGFTETEVEQTLARATVPDGRLCPEDIPRILQAKADKIKDSELLEYYPVDEQTAELGGFQKLKDWLERAAMGFTPEAAELNLPAPCGVLIVGVQGCGKSLCAKVISRTWKLPLVKLEAGRLYDKYIGESERNFRKAIKLVESVSPASFGSIRLRKPWPPAITTAAHVSDC
jgi:SpoVK/Ycf46/Vps4 family AAA+-type ATPase